jgi:hypothetical protein
VLEDAWRVRATPCTGAVAGACLLAFRYSPEVAEELIAFLGSPAATGDGDAYVVQMMASETIANALTLHTVNDRERRLHWGLLLDDARKGKAQVHPRLPHIAGDHIERLVGTRAYKDDVAVHPRQVVGTGVGMLGHAMVDGQLSHLADWIEHLARAHLPGFRSAAEVLHRCIAVCRARTLRSPAWSGWCRKLVGLAGFELLGTEGSRALLVKAHGNVDARSVRRPNGHLVMVSSTLWHVEDERYVAEELDASSL